MVKLYKSKYRTSEDKDKKEISIENVFMNEWEETIKDQKYQLDLIFSEDRQVGCMVAVIV